MSFGYNESSVKEVFFDETECKMVTFNGTKVWEKRAKIIAAVSGGSCSVDDYWYPNSSCAARYTAPYDGYIDWGATVSGAVGWINGGRFYGPISGRDYVKAGQSWTKSISIGIASGCSNGSGSVWGTFYET